MDRETREALDKLWASVERLRGRVERLTLWAALVAALLLGERAWTIIGL